MDLEEIVNLLVALFGNARFAQTIDFSLSSGQYDSGIGMGLEDPLDGLPGAGVPVPLQGVFDKAQKLVGQNGDKDVALNARFNLVVVGSEAQVALERFEAVFGPGQSHVEAPQLGPAEVVPIGAQHRAAQQLSILITGLVPSSPAKAALFLFRALGGFDQFNRIEALHSGMLPLCQRRTETSPRLPV